MIHTAFSPKAWDDYLHWQEIDRRTLKKINTLIKSVRRGDGLGKAETLKHYAGNARRIDEKNRLVFEVDGDYLLLTRLRGHYGDH